MTVDEMRELIRTSKLFLEQGEITFITDTGDRVTLEEAINKGFRVIPRRNVDGVIQKFEQHGIAIKDTLFMNRLMVLHELVKGNVKSTPKKGSRKLYSLEEKKEWYTKFFKTTLTASAFCKENGLNYQTFLKWKDEMKPFFKELKEE